MLNVHCSMYHTILCICILYIFVTGENIETWTLNKSTIKKQNIVCSVAMVTMVVIHHNKQLMKMKDHFFRISLWLQWIRTQLSSLHKLNSKIYSRRWISNSIWGGGTMNYSRYAMNINLMTLSKFHSANTIFSVNRFMMSLVIYIRWTFPLFHLVSIKSITRHFQNFTFSYLDIEKG